MIAVQYDPATGEIVAYGQFDAAPDGLLLGYVPDAAPLMQSGSKRLVHGAVEVTPPPPPPPPTADEIAAAQQDAGDRDTVRQAAVALLADATALADATVTLTAAQQRAMLARTDRAIVALARTLRRAGLV